MVNHFGHLTLCVNSKFTCSLQWLLHFFFILQISHLNSLRSCLILHQKQKLSEMSFLIFPWLTLHIYVVLHRGSTNLFPLVSKDEIFLPIEGLFLIPVQFPPFTLSKISLLWLTSPLSAYIFITFPSYCIIPILYKHAPSFG